MNRIEASVERFKSAAKFSARVLIEPLRSSVILFHLGGLSPATYPWVLPVSASAISYAVTKNLDLSLAIGGGVYTTEGLAIISANEAFFNSVSCKIRQMRQGARVINRAEFAELLTENTSNPEEDPQQNNL